MTRISNDRFELDCSPGPFVDQVQQVLADLDEPDITDLAASGEFWCLMETILEEAKS
jgi:hypothetical protein